MAKTYILQPTEAAFTITTHGELKVGVTFDWTALDGYPGDEADDEAISAFYENTFSGSKFEMMYGEEPISLIYAGLSQGEEPVFTVSGEYVEDSYPIASVTFRDIDLMNIEVVVAAKPVAGTYTVSIYKETEDGDEDDGGIPGLPNKNVILNYENPTNNGIALITKAVLWDGMQAFESMDDEAKAEFNDVLYNPGYAPMERLVKAIVVIKENPDPYRSGVVLTNDLERIAFAICPEMFGSNTPVPVIPDPPIGGAS